MTGALAEVPPVAPVPPVDPADCLVPGSSHASARRAIRSPEAARDENERTRFSYGRPDRDAKKERAAEHRALEATSFVGHGRGGFGPCLKAGGRAIVELPEPDTAGIAAASLQQVEDAHSSALRAFTQPPVEGELDAGSQPRV
jgi:hypothetical protein